MQEWRWGAARKAQEINAMFMAKQLEKKMEQASGPWGWGKGQSEDKKAVAFTQAGPVMSQRELEGLKFGLHRPGFLPKQPVMKSIKLLVGLEVAVADAINFPLVDRLCGVGMEYLVHIMKQCPGAVIALQGQGTKLGGQDLLHFKITAKDDLTLNNAKILADNLVKTVLEQYEEFKASLTLSAYTSFPTTQVYAYPPLTPISAPIVPPIYSTPVPWGSQTSLNLSLQIPQSESTQILTTSLSTSTENTLVPPSVQSTDPTSTTIGTPDLLSEMNNLLAASSQLIAQSEEKKSDQKEDSINHLKEDSNKTSKPSKKKGSKRKLDSEKTRGKKGKKEKRDDEYDPFADAEDD